MSLIALTVAVTLGLIIGPLWRALSGKNTFSFFGSFWISLALCDSLEILSISAQDHYVEITTEKGVGLPLREAVKHLKYKDGAQIHRSYWVAWREVDTLIEMNGKGTVVLKSGVNIPISANNLNLVKAGIAAGRH